MATLLKELSVFFPAYNLENQIEKTLNEAFKVIPKIAKVFEIIVIDDGSGDGTAKVISKLQKQYKNLKVITHPVNRGYGAALKSGLYGAKFSWIAFTDGDGQFDISELPKLIQVQKKEKTDIVVGYYLNRKVSELTIITSKVWELIIYILFGLKVRDIDCGFKLISKKVIEKIPKLESERGAFISSEFLIKAKRGGFKIAEVGVSHFERSGKGGSGRHLNVIIKSFVDLFRLWIKLNNEL